MHGPPRAGRKDGLDIPGHADRTDWTYRVTADRTEGRTGHTGSPRTGRKDGLDIPGHRGTDGLDIPGHPGPSWKVCRVLVSQIQ